VVDDAGKTMPTVDDVRKSVGDGGSLGDGLLQGPAGAALDGDVLLDYTERVQSFFPECRTLFLKVLLIILKKCVKLYFNELQGAFSVFSAYIIKVLFFNMF
jgi:hypothetical protein